MSRLFLAVVIGALGSLWYHSSRSDHSTRQKVLHTAGAIAVAYGAMYALELVTGVKAERLAGELPLLKSGKAPF
jgi:hypothetical protein